MSMVVSFFPEVLIPSQSPFLLRPHARLICFYQAVCYMEDLHFIILGFCNGSKHEHLSAVTFPFLIWRLDQPSGFSPKGWKHYLAVDSHVCILHCHHLAPC